MAVKNQTGLNSNSTNATADSHNIYGNMLPFTVGFSIQFFFSFIGNLLIVWIVYKDKRLKTTTNYLMANMAVSDLFAAIVVFPTQIVWINNDYRWLVDGSLGNALCKLHIFIVEVSFTVSLFTCVFVAIDRFFAVAFPLKKPFQRKMKSLISGIWIVSGILKSPFLIVFATIKNGQDFYCDARLDIYAFYRNYYLTIATLTVGLPAPIVSLIYVLIVYKLNRHKTPGNQTDANIRRRNIQNRKVLKMSVTIVALLYLSWGCWFVLVILHAHGLMRRVSLFDLDNASRFILYMSLVYNFFVYLVFNSIYRKNIINGLARCCPLNRVNDFTYMTQNSGISYTTDSTHRPAVIQIIKLHDISQIDGD